jgi:hypothetical protein
MENLFASDLACVYADEGKMILLYFHPFNSFNGKEDKSIRSDISQKE